MLHRFDGPVSLSHCLLPHPRGALVELLPIEIVTFRARLVSLQLQFQLLILILQTATLLEDLVGEFHSRVYKDETLQRALGIGLFYSRHVLTEHVVRVFQVFLQAANVCILLDLIIGLAEVDLAAEVLNFFVGLILDPRDLLLFSVSPNSIYVLQQLIHQSL